MSPEPLPGRAFRACGGDVVSRCGQPLASCPIAFFRYLGAQAAARRRSDPAAARHCARMALELAEAILEAHDWRRASGGAPGRDSRLRGETLLTNEVNALRQSLRKA
jgi:hypothetical protein